MRVLVLLVYLTALWETNAAVDGESV